MASNYRQGVHCYTSFTFSYLSRALILNRTLKAAHPDWTFWALLVDEAPATGAFDSCLAAFDQVIYARDLEIEQFESWLFKHDIVEACTAVKGRMLQHLLDIGAEKVIYLDPDIAVFHPLDDIVSQLNTSSIVVTPHQINPNKDASAIRDNELTSLQYGVFNLGFIGVRNDLNGRAFSDWWADSLYFACYDDVPSGIFTDQKWCDLVPCFFDGVFVSRDPGCNVASWNLSQRNVEIGRDGVIRVDGSTLKFYHFTKINSIGDVMTDRYLGERLGAVEVWNWYKRALQSIVTPAVPAGYWHYGLFENGVSINQQMRLIYRQRNDLSIAFPNPFQSEYYEWLCNETELLANVQD